MSEETEHDRKLGGSPGLNPIRKLYYRELVARFGHHLAVLWNLCEENNKSDADRKANAAYIRALDPYDYPITVHTHNNRDPTRYALQFFRDYLPFTEMQPDNELTSNAAEYCFAKPGDIYAIYLPDGGSTELKLMAGSCSIHWYNPRTGGGLQRGSVKQVDGPGSKFVGQAPDDQGKDWAVLVRNSALAPKIQHKPATR